MDDWLHHCHHTTDARYKCLVCLGWVCSRVEEATVSCRLRTRTRVMTKWPIHSKPTKRCRRRSIGGHAASSPFRLFALSSASHILRAIVKLVTKWLDSGPTTMAALQPRRRFMYHRQSDVIHCVTLVFEITGSIHTVSLRPNRFDCGAVWARSN
jgi:hypothetical protein